MPGLGTEVALHLLVRVQHDTVGHRLRRVTRARRRQQDRSVFLSELRRRMRHGVYRVRRVWAQGLQGQSIEGKNSRAIQRFC